MKLKSLSLENYQGIKAADLSPNGSDLTIKGENGTGKTTIGSAISWLIFDKPITGEKGYTPKTKAEDGSDVHYLHHAAEGTFILDDGSEITLKRDFHEVWTKKKGSATEEFSGHVIDHYIDGVPVKEKEYKARLDAIADPEKMKILTMPEYFPQTMDWKARRATLLDVCGDVSDEDVLNSTGELKGLREYLKKQGTSGQMYTVDEYTAIATSQRSKINKDLQMIPARIDEAQKAIPDIKGLNAEKIDAQIATLTEKKEGLERRKLETGTNDRLTELRQQIAAQNLKLLEAETEHEKALREANKQVNSKIKVAETYINDGEREISRLKSDLAKALRDVSQMEEQRVSLLEKYAAIKAEVWEGETTCRTCGQPIPEDKVAEAKELFNLDKSARLMATNQKGRETCSKEMIEICKETIAGIEAEIVCVNKKIEDSKGEVKQASLSIDSTEFTETEEYAAIRAEISRIQDLASTEGNSISEVTKGLQGEIEGVAAKIAEFQDKKSSIRTAKAQQDRVKELEESEKWLASEYEKIERGVYLCQLFVKTKVDMLTESINEKFKNVRFRLFAEQINGGIPECCDVLVPCKEGLIPYQSANTAGRINASLELIDTFGQHYGVTMPIILDNCESVLHPIKTNAQQIRLIAADNYHEWEFQTA